MTSLSDLYFEWLLEKVSAPKNFSRVLRTLFVTPFVFTMPMDGNRYDDGIDLRYRFGAENGISDDEISDKMGEKECSLLEMMVALAIRCEDQIMTDDSYGDRTSLWFRNMMESLGLGLFRDPLYQERAVLDIIDTLYARSYSPNGKGGLFTIKTPNIDMRYFEIWEQAMAYLNEVIASENSEEE